MTVVKNDNKIQTRNTIVSDFKHALSEKVAITTTTSLLSLN